MVSIAVNLLAWFAPGIFFPQMAARTAEVKKAKKADKAAKKAAKKAARNGSDDSQQDLEMSEAANKV
jgi:hypothetical protein